MFNRQQWNLLIFWTRIEIKHRWIWVIKRHWSLLMWEAVLTPSLYVWVRAHWGIGCWVARGDLSWGSGWGGTAGKLIRTSLDHRISSKGVHLGLLMTLTFYEYPQLYEMISWIKSSIKVTDPLLRKSRVLYKITINSKWLEWICFGLFTQQIARGTAHFF